MATAESVYLQRIVDRQEYLDEAFKSAKVTIPAIIPDADDIRLRTTPATLNKPFQSLGARGVNNLAAKLLLTLLPSSSSFFRYFISEAIKDEAEAKGEDLTELQSRLARREARINTEVELQGLRPKVYQILRHLLIAGNVLAYLQPEGGLRVFSLNAYVAKRDGTGKLLDLIYSEQVDRESITDEKILAILALAPPDKTDSSRKTVDLWTRVILEEDDRYHSWQEIAGEKIPDTDEYWKADLLPWLALRYTSIDGEDYGRGFVEEYRGDLTSFEQLSRDTQFASANAAKVVWRINPTSVLKPKKFQDAPNGGAVLGNEGDIEAIRLDKGGDMQVAILQMDRLERSLSASFMLNSSFQRNAERVTAEEIRRLAQELEDTLGGVFSLLSQEFQLPLARILETGLSRRDKGFKPLPKGSVRVGVVTGLAAIGRNQDLERLVNGITLVAEASAVFPGLRDYVVESDLSRRIWTGSGVETDGLLKTDQMVQQERQAAQQAQSQQILGGELAKGAGKAAGNVDPAIVAQTIQQQAAQAA